MYMSAKRKHAPVSAVDVCMHTNAYIPAYVCTYIGMHACMHAGTYASKKRRKL